MTDHPTVRALREGKARIEKGWCQGRLAKDACGRETDPEGPEAVAWCVFGAISTPGGDLSPADVALIRAHGNNYVADWNDEPERKKEDVLALFDKAIALIEVGKA